MPDLHSRSVVVEAHRDCYEQIYRLQSGEPDPINDVMAPRLRSGGIDITVYAIGGDTAAHSWGTAKPLLSTLANIDALVTLVEERPSNVAIVRTREDIPDEPDGMSRLILHLEGGSPLEGRLSSLRSLYRLGLRSMQLTWNIRNEIGDGCMEERTGGGLTQFGVSVVREMNRLGMIIDLAHISEAGFWQALDLAEGPVVVSHANAKALFFHQRNITDDQVKAVAATGGVVGVQVTPKFLRDGGATVEDLLDHICHFGDLVGYRHVGLGLDFSMNDGPRPIGEKNHPGRQRVLEGMREAEDLPALTVALLDRGLSENDVALVLGGSFCRVYRSVLHTK